MHFLTYGLYVEPDPHRIATNHPWYGKPTLGDIQRRQNQSRELIESIVLSPEEGQLPDRPEGESRGDARGDRTKEKAVGI